MFTIEYGRLAIIRVNVNLFLAMTNAVRHCMESRFQRFETNTPAAPMKLPMKDPMERILELNYLMNPPTEADNDLTLESLLNGFIKNGRSVLQEQDIQRLRALIYRDVVRQDRSKTGKNAVIVVVNFALI
jgi:hypothetical protein